ncbi:hypothetical protein FGO68_gene17062 [Halteria grandinella]|uniref:Protein kinase domain-containing protein n=1 Tax=Halteria grandinella TaxID=5974 RepID=A0A8J8SWR9_HALGN|nr:hypothetical protein FGO68_gene17062 [Halteria grandinella]
MKGCQYQLIRVLGRGTFGLVLLAHDILSKKDVAIKLCLGSKDIDLEYAKQEIKILRIVKEGGGDSFVQMLDAFKWRGHQCMVFELYKEGDLYSQVVRRMEQNERRGVIGVPRVQGYTIGQIREIAKQLLQALAFLEDTGIIHCDLKPENILIESADPSNLKVRLADLGSSLLTSELHRLPTPLYVQSRFYRAPEVLLQRKAPITAKIDMWSLGCVLAELYMSNKRNRYRALFGGSNAGEQLEQIKRMYTRYGSDMRCIEYAIGFAGEESTVENYKYIDFLTKCLTVDPELRISAKAALQHPWITDY